MISPPPTGGRPTVHPSVGADSARRIGGPVRIAPGRADEDAHPDPKMLTFGG